MTPVSPTDPDGYLELIRRAPMLDALCERPLDRQALEERLGISRATSHRFTRWLGDRGLVERIDGEFHPTELGRAISASVTEFKTDVTTAFHLAPVLEALGDTDPAVPLAAFGDAAITSPAYGDPHGPMTRYVSLLRESTTLRGFDTWAIAPTYMDEIQERILDGMETELVDPISVVEDIMDNYPERCVEVCVSGNLTIRLHESLPFGLALFDDRIGIAVCDPETNTLSAFIDTDAPDARAWAEAIYGAYRAESVPLETFTRKGLREAMAVE